MSHITNNAPSSPQEHDGEVSYPYARDSTGQTVHISQARPSQTYTCCTDGCGRPMIPRLGSIRKPHFAHKGNTGTSHCTPERSTHDGFVSELVSRLNRGPIEFILNCQMTRHSDVLRAVNARPEVNLNDPERRPDVLLLGNDGRPEAAIEVILSNYPEQDKILDLSTWARHVYFIVIPQKAQDAIRTFYDKPVIDGVLISKRLCTTNKTIQSRARGVDLIDCSADCRKRLQSFGKHATLGIVTAACRSYGWVVAPCSNGDIRADKETRTVSFSWSMARDGRLLIGMSIVEEGRHIKDENIVLNWSPSGFETKTLKAQILQFLPRYGLQLRNGSGLPPYPIIDASQAPERPPPQIPLDLAPDASVEDLVSKITELQGKALAYRSHHGCHSSPYDTAIEEVCRRISERPSGRM
jgi:hypothetical protein